jgi:hypothetical protein
MRVNWQLHNEKQGVKRVEHNNPRKTQQLRKIKKVWSRVELPTVGELPRVGKLPGMGTTHTPK